MEIKLKPCYKCQGEVRIFSCMSKEHWNKYVARCKKCNNETVLKTEPKCYKNNAIKLLPSNMRLAVEEYNRIEV